jgi:hypothetical protein
MFVARYSHTQAGIDRRAQQRGRPLPAIEAAKVESKHVATQSNVVRFRKRPARVYVPTRIPSAKEVSRARHMAYLATVNFRPKPEDLIKRVAAWHDLCYRDIITDIRFRHFVEARNDCIAAVRIAFPKYSLECLALTFSRTHVSVLNALRKRGLA